MSKEEWIEKYRLFADSILDSVLHRFTDYKSQASEINKLIKKEHSQTLTNLERRSIREHWREEDLLHEVLLSTYASYIVMLEYRNKVWPYEYMAFARRIGELWEPFCKLPFYHPIKKLSLVDPPDFDDVQNEIVNNAYSFIHGLGLSNKDEQELKTLYSIPWSLVDSGGIKLSLDLHFEQNSVRYNCDYKSGFSSNEKGNTNRLLLVGSIYRSLPTQERTILFVRQREDENNHYLQTLKNSPYWEVFCSNECYTAIHDFTGFNLRHWLDTNVDWQNDISEEFCEHLTENDLLKYLTW